jgi:hypothetical protein
MVQGTAVLPAAIPSAQGAAMTSAVTGQQYQIGAGSYRATVTELGAGLRELLFGGQPVIAGYEADELPPGGAGQLLAPGRTGSMAGGTSSAAPSSSSPPPSPSTRTPSTA